MWGTDAVVNLHSAYRDHFLSRTQQQLLDAAMRNMQQHEAAARTLQRRCQQQLAYEEQRLAALAAANARRRLERERQRVELKHSAQLDRLAARLQVRVSHGSWPHTPRWLLEWVVRELVAGVGSGRVVWGLQVLVSVWIARSVLIAPALRLPITTDVRGHGARNGGGPTRATAVRTTTQVRAHCCPA